MHTKKINILNTTIDNLTMVATLTTIKESISKKKQIYLVVVNASTIVDLQTDKELRKSINNSEIITADGQSVVWASKILKKPLKEKVTGFEVMDKMVAISYKYNYKIFFLGATEEVVKEVVKKYSKKYSSKIIAGYRNGYFNKTDEPKISEEIAESGADILFVAISSPIKENFLSQNKEKLKNVSFIMGVGGCFDIISGKTKRAPIWMQNSGLEWFYRFLQEPKRMWKRYLIGNSKFIWLVFKEKLRLNKKLND